MVEEKLSAHEEEGEVVETPTHDEEPTKSIVLHDFGYEKVSLRCFIDVCIRLLLSKSLYPRLARRIRNPRTAK